MLVPFGGKLSGGVITQSIRSRHPSYARYGEDVVLTNVLSFDVQVWDPTVQVKNNGGTGSIAWRSWIHGWHGIRPACAGRLCRLV